MHGGAKYSTVFVEYRKRFTYFFETEKIDAVTSSKIAGWFLSWCEKNIPEKVKVIRSDRGSDYTSKMFGKLLLNRGINQEFCPPDRHGQVGKAEKRIADMCENAKTMLLTSSHP